MKPNSMNRFLIPGVCALSMLSLGVFAQDPDISNNPPGGPGQNNPDANHSVQFPNVEMRLVIDDYERVTGRKVIAAPDILDQTVTIETSKLMTRDEYLDYMERALLLHGYVFVDINPTTSMVLGVSTSNIPNRPIPYIRNSSSLPHGEKVIHYVMQLDYISTEEAARVFQEVLSPDPSFGGITTVPGNSMLFITERADVVRQMIEMKESIDKQAARVETRFYQLERAAAEDVATIIQDILQQQETNQQNTANRRTVAARTRQPAQAPPGTNAMVTNNRASSPAAPPESQNVIIRADARTNRVVAIARPIDFIFIEKLITELDRASEVKNFVKRALTYVPVYQVLPVLADAVRNQEEITSSSMSAGGSSIGSRGRSTSGRSSGGRTGTTGLGQSNARGAIGGNQGGGSRGAGAATGEVFGDENDEPLSEMTEKTLLVADQKANTIIVSGPPESIVLVQELIDQLDIRPKQVYLSTVIGQVTLGDDITTGVDLLRDVKGQFTVDGRDVRLGGLFKTDGGGFLDVRNGTPTLEQLASLSNGINLYGTIGEFAQFYMKMLESTNRFKVISRPSLFVSNNRTGVISNGQEVAVPSSTQSSFTGGTTGTGLISNFQYKDVLLELRIRPLINNKDEITLEIQQINDEIVGTDVLSGQELPRVSTQEIETEVTVANKSTIVLGGLITERRNETNTGLPVVTRIPLLKHLTGRTANTLSRQELLIFIQPHIISGDDDMVDYHMEATRHSAVTDDVLDLARGDFLDRDQGLSPRFAKPKEPTRPKRRFRWPFRFGKKR